MTERSPIESLQSDGQAFGRSLAFEMKNRRGLTPSARASVNELRETIIALLESDMPQDKRVSSDIIESFRRNDQYEFEKAAGRRRKIGKQSVLEWLAGASDKDFVALVKWNHDRREALIAQINQDADELVEISLDKTAKLVEMDYFPTDASRRVRLAAEQFRPFTAMDAFETGAMHAAGYFNGSVISLTNMYLLSAEHHGISPVFERTMFHELLHAAGYVSGGGFHFHDKPLQGRLWEEAFITHSTEVAFAKKSAHPQIDVFDPARRISNVTMSYSEERQLFAEIAAEDMANVPARQWAHAFFDASDNRHQQAVAKSIRLAFDKFDETPSALTNFNAAYEETWANNNAAARSRLLTETAIKIYHYRGVSVETLSDDQESDTEPIFIVRQWAADETDGQNIQI